MKRIIASIAAALALAVTAAAATLEWDPPPGSAIVVGYRLYEKLTGKDGKVTWKLVATTQETRYPLKDPTPGRVFAVTAYNNVSESERSNEVTIPDHGPITSAPRELRVTED